MAVTYVRNQLTGEFEQVGAGGATTDTTLSQVGRPADAAAVGIALAQKQSKGVYVINGLTPMESHLPPFTANEYAIAYNNGLLIHNTIQQHCDKYKTFVIDEGSYPVCYQYNDGTGRTANDIHYIFNLADNVKLDMQGAELWVMYDSDNKSPYDHRTGTTNAYQFGGVVVGLANVHDVEICNGKITGERELRSFANSTENRVENTTGINMLRCCFNIHIHDMDINSFMADSINANSIYGANGGYYESAPITMETLTNNGVIGSASTIWGHTDMTKIPTECIGVPVYIWTGIGYNYVMSNHLGMFLYLYDDNETFITYMAVDQSEPFVIKKSLNATKYRLYIGSSTAIQSIAYRFTTECSNKVLIEDCKISNNQRGGISNMPISTVIQRCMFDNCGYGSYGGKPTFFDSTRYCIDLEDIASQDLTVRDCKFTNSFHGILSGAINAVYDNNTFVNMNSSVLIYRGKNIRIINNRFYSCSFPKYASSVQEVNCRQTKVLVANNSGLITGSASFNNGWSYSNNSIVATGFYNDGNVEVDLGHSVMIPGEPYIKGVFSGILDILESTYVCRPTKSGGIDSKRGLQVSANGRSIRWFTADYLKNISLNITDAINVIEEMGAAWDKRDIVIEGCSLTTDGPIGTLRYFGDNVNTLTANNCEFNLCDALYNEVRINGPYTPNIVFNNCTFNWSGITKNVNMFGTVSRYGNNTSAGSLTFNNCKFKNDSTEFTVTIKSSGTDKTYTFNDCIADSTVVL